MFTSVWQKDPQKHALWLCFQLLLHYYNLVSSSAKLWFQNGHGLKLQPVLVLPWSLLFGNPVSESCVQSEKSRPFCRKIDGPEAGDLQATTAYSKLGFANAFFSRALMHNARVWKLQSHPIVPLFLLAIYPCWFLGLEPTYTLLYLADFSLTLMFPVALFVTRYSEFTV